MSDLRPYMSGVSGLLIAVGTPFLFIISIFSLPLTPVLAAESPITDSSISESLIAESPTTENPINEIPIAESLIGAESIPFNENPAYGPGDDESGMSAVSEIAPFQEPIEENGDLSPGAITPGMEGIEGQYQMQLLQSEVMELRGLLEELTFHFERMRGMQEDRYLELDKRFQSLSQGGVDTGASSNVQPGTTDPNNGAGSTQAPGQDEKTLYETALELIRNRQYDLAITQLEEVIAQFPDGTYAPNAYYWLGEVYAAKPEPDYEKARQALAQVISFFPDHRKVPDAAFKLGKVYNLMGDCARARDILNQVIEQHKGKSVSKLAESYLRDNVNCEKQ